MTEEVKVIKRFKSFILGYCKCGRGNEIKIITSSWQKGLGHWLQTHKSGHNRMDYSKRKLPTRENHSNYKGGIKKITKDYLGILRPHHKFAIQRYVLLHRYRMELMLGRYLTEEEVVHHIDGDTFNNEESNLMLFANHSEHMTYERTKDMSGRSCKVCGSKITRIKLRNGKQYVEWYGNENDGFICARCYRKVKNRIQYLERKKLLVSQ